MCTGADCVFQLDEPVGIMTTSGEESTNRKAKRSRSQNGPPHKRTLSDGSNDSQEDLHMMNSEVYAEFEYKIHCQNNRIVPPPPSPEKCARNARAKMALLVMDQEEEEEFVKMRK